MWDDELDQLALIELTEAYMLRTRWEARVHAVSIGELLAGAMGNQGKQQQQNSKWGPRVPASSMLGMLGVKV